eukprot:15455654-Alexandrium_andersonii.AAC.1
MGLSGRPTARASSSPLTAQTSWHSSLTSFACLTVRAPIYLAHLGSSTLDSFSAPQTSDTS